MAVIKPGNNTRRSAAIVLVLDVFLVLAASYSLCVFLGICAWPFSATHLFSKASVSSIHNSSVTKFGIHFTDSRAIEVGQALHIQAERFSYAMGTAVPPSAANIAAAEKAGIGAVVTYTNVANPNGTGTRTDPRAGPTPDAVFETSFTAALDATHPTIAVMQNEEDNLASWGGTTDEYLHMLSLAARIAHAKRYPITNGGISSGGLDIAYWHYLWMSGDHQAADAFARVAFAANIITDKKQILGDIPDSTNPARVIFGNNSILRAKLTRVEALIVGYKATGIDYINAHWYEVPPSAKGRALAWLGQTTGLQVMSNEMGVYETNPPLITSMLNEAITLQMPYAVWNANIGMAGNNSPLVDQSTAAILPNGIAFKDFVLAHP
ncbi:hypothetical protein H0X32_02195 [Patescibacteria group bacterium]|nr:hypothetical protein [Patescibacteria group bacterium]